MTLSQNKTKQAKDPPPKGTHAVIPTLVLGRSVGQGLGQLISDSASCLRKPCDLKSFPASERWN